MELKSRWQKFKQSWQERKPDWQKLKPNREKIRALWQKVCSGWKPILRKCVSYILVAVVTFGCLSALNFWQTAKSMEHLEAEKQALEEKKQELENTLATTEKLLGQLNLSNQDIQKLLAAADQKGTEVSDKIKEMLDAFDEAEEIERQKWVMPIRYVACTSYFGLRQHPVAGEAIFHSGVDLAAPQGTPIVATRSGNVTTATYEENAGYYVNIDHLDGYVSRYMHMSKFIVTEGQFVMAGQVIGYCGASGVATGSHLHFGIYHNGEAVNPSKYIDI